METKPFSDQLESWLTSKKPRTILSLNEVFAERSFAITFLIFMALPALPIPTGGITHVFEIIVMLLCLELIAGRRTIWLPKRWQNKEVPGAIKRKLLPILMRRVRWFEKYSRSRLGWLINHPMSLRFLGLIILVLTVFAFIAPPFSGLDTLPAMGVFVISLGLVLNDVIILILGLIVGCTGAALTITLGAAITKAIQGLFH
jgi:hypothetical protein